MTGAVLVLLMYDVLEPLSSSRRRARGRCGDGERVAPVRDTERLRGHRRPRPLRAHRRQPAAAATPFPPYQSNLTHLPCPRCRLSLTRRPRRDFAEPPRRILHLQVVKQALLVFDGVKKIDVEMDAHCRNSRDVSAKWFDRSHGIC